MTAEWMVGRRRRADVVNNGKEGEALAMVMGGTQATQATQATQTGVVNYEWDL